MGTAPTTVYQPLSFEEQVFKDLIWNPMIKAGENWIEGAVPILNIPVIKQLDEAVINDITDAIFNNLILMIDIESITLVNDGRQAAYQTASEQLVIIATEKGSDSDEYKKAQSDALAALAKFSSIAH